MTKPDEFPPRTIRTFLNGDCIDARSKHHIHPIVAGLVERVEYLSVEEHEALLKEAVAESRIQAFSEAIDILKTTQELKRSGVMK
jgi:hypothetical protein